MNTVKRTENPFLNRTAKGSVPLRALVTSVALLFTSQVTAETFELSAPRENAIIHQADGSETFRLLSGECSDLEYFSTELNTSTSDCSRELNRIEYYETSMASAGDRLLYEWEIFVPKDFRYNALNERLTVVQFKTVTDMLYGFELNNEGYTFRAQNCISAKDFGDWHKVSVRIHYDSTRRKTLKDKTPGCSWSSATAK